MSLYSKAVCYINILEKIIQNKGSQCLIHTIYRNEIQGESPNKQVGVGEGIRRAKQKNNRHPPYVYLWSVVPLRMTKIISLALFKMNSENIY